MLRKKAETLTVVNKVSHSYQLLSKGMSQINVTRMKMSFNVFSGVSQERVEVNEVEEDYIRCISNQRELQCKGFFSVHIIIKKI